MQKEIITRQPDFGSLVCICKNVDTSQGFYPCDVDGNEIEPTPEYWTGLYVCDNCGRIIQVGTLEVVGRRHINVDHTAANFFAKHGEPYVLGNLANHFTNMSTCDGVAVEYLMADALRLVDALEKVKIVDEE